MRLGEGERREDGIKGKGGAAQLNLASCIIMLIHYLHKMCMCVCA